MVVPTPTRSPRRSCTPPSPLFGARQQSIGRVHAALAGDGPDARRARHATTRAPREPATTPSRSTRRTRPAGCRPAKWTAGSSRGHSPTDRSNQRPTAQNDPSSARSAADAKVAPAGGVRRADRPIGRVSSQRPLRLWAVLASRRALSSQTPTSGCRSATSGRQARARESPPGAGHAAIGTRVALRPRPRLPARQHVRP